MPKLNGKSKKCRDEHHNKYTSPWKSYKDHVLHSWKDPAKSSSGKTWFSAKKLTAINWSHSQQCQWKMDVRTNSTQQVGKNVFLFLLLPSFSVATIFKPAQLSMYWFLSIFSDSIYICTFWDTAFHCWPCRHRLSSQLLVVASSSTLHPQQPHRVHLPSTMMSGQISGVSRAAKCRQGKAALPFLHLMHLFSLRKSFHTNLCPSYLLLAHFTQWAL